MRCELYSKIEESVITKCFHINTVEVYQWPETQSDEESDINSIEFECSFTIQSDEQFQSDDEHSFTTQSDEQPSHPSVQHLVLPTLMQSLPLSHHSPDDQEQPNTASKTIKSYKNSANTLEPHLIGNEQSTQRKIPVPTCSSQQTRKSPVLPPPPAPARPQIKINTFQDHPHTVTVITNNTLQDHTRVIQATDNAHPYYPVYHTNTPFKDHTYTQRDRIHHKNQYIYQF